MESLYDGLFSNPKPIIGMIHLAGDSPAYKIETAKMEMGILIEEGVDGAIVEDYNLSSSKDDVLRTLDAIIDVREHIVIGVNLLSAPLDGIRIASEYGLGFVQLDDVLNIDSSQFNRHQEEYNNVAIFGGVGFKYTPSANRRITHGELELGKKRCDVIVTTGEGTGSETPIHKLAYMKSYLQGFPLFIGAGLNIGNAQQQLGVSDGAIVGSYFKNDNLEDNIDRERVREIIQQRDRVLRTLRD